MILHVLIAALLSAVFTYSNSFSVHAQKFEMDDLGNYYFLDGQVIEKRDSKGVVLFRNSELNYGRIDHIDLTNPMQPFLYYKEQGKVLILDNTLSAQGQLIDLFEKGFGQVECIGGSRGDAFWIWDVSKTELIKVDKQFNQLNTSGNISMLLGKTLHPTQIIEKGNDLYLFDKAEGVFVFDIYGNYKTSLIIKADDSIQIVNGSIAYTAGGFYKVLSWDRISETSTPLPAECKSTPHYFGNSIHFLENNSLRVYKIEE
jgi:ribosomal protein L27